MSNLADKFMPAKTMQITSQTKNLRQERIAEEIARDIDEAAQTGVYNVVVHFDEGVSERVVGLIYNALISQGYTVVTPRKRMFNISWKVVE